ncbi:MAG: DNA topoisomerase III [Fibromonadaceae bacterium]|jgi:DNA topoisomerase-3|nr:DNA topoisomerase III [Fibromonadaceae bacterium]
MKTESTVAAQTTLVIAEKPSVANDLAKALGGKFRKDKSYLESEGTIISWALGHLVGIADPKEMGEKYKKWEMATLPIIPEEFKLVPLPDTKSHLAALGKLIRRKDIGTIINACDAGREGELIFYYILEHEQGKAGLAGKTIKRLWMQSMTSSAIKNAFEHLRANEEMKKLQDAALSRSEADWLVGINGSRGLTAYNNRFGGFQLTPCGRVQTPTLALIVKREESRMAFVSEPFWTLTATFEDEKNLYTGKWTNQKGNSAKIWKKEEAESVLRKCEGKRGNASEESKQVTQKCPPLYDLTFLQREANSRFGFSARTTLQIAQSLYEKHKLATYPRTDSKFLPDDYVPLVKKTMGALTGSIAKHAEAALKNNYVYKNPRIFNSAKVSDHHAIIPTGNAPKALSEAEQKIFNLICQRFVAVFYPAAEYLHTIRTTIVEGETFVSEGKILKESGWKAVYGKDSEDEDIMPPLSSPSANPLTKEIEMLQDCTKPPARYTESTLLSAMESAGKLVEDEDLRDAMKERGLGTPATRAATIEKLIFDKYLTRDGKELLPTGKAFDLINMAISMQIENLTSPELTGEWEYKLGLMEKGQVSRKDFMRDIESLTSHMVDKIKNFKESDTKKEAVAEAAGEKIHETVSNYETDSGIRIRKILGGRHISIAEVAELLEKKKIGPLTGFRSKKGKEFSAALILSEKNKIEFVFDDLASAEGREALDFSGQTPLGNSPRDNSPVYETLTAFVSESFAKGMDTGLRLTKSILGKQITTENVQKLLSGGKTDLIKGFRSAKTRRLFDAFLKIDKNGKIGFEFPPPKARKKKD